MSARMLKAGGGASHKNHRAKLETALRLSLALFLLADCVSTNHNAGRASGVILLALVTNRHLASNDPHHYVDSTSSPAAASGLIAPMALDQSGNLASSPDVHLHSWLLFLHMIHGVSHGDAGLFRCRDAGAFVTCPLDVQGGKQKRITQISPREM